QGISSDTDRRVFALLRTLCDVILVGASTVREEKYKPARPQELWSHLREGRPPTPPIAVVTGRLDLDPDSPLITAAPAYARTIVITTASAPAARRDQLGRHAEIIIAGQDTVDLRTAVDALAERGHRRMLAEGGAPHLALLTPGGQAQDPHLAAVPPAQPLHALHRGGLARAVRAQDAEDLTFVDVERDVVHDRLTPVLLGEPGHLDDGRHHAP